MIFFFRVHLINFHIDGAINDDQSDTPLTREVREIGRREKKWTLHQLQTAGNFTRRHDADSGLQRIYAYFVGSRFIFGASAPLGGAENARAALSAR